MRAFIIVDLGFGDSGKGILTDFLTRRLNSSLVVRYNGGAQAGHNVIAPDGRHHTFSQFGSGTFISGVKTYLSKYVVIHPGALLVEGDVLVNKGVPDAFSRLRISDQALIITPFHQAANRIREIVRGQNRHGSCGVGVGEAFEDALTNPEDRVSTGDLSNIPVLKRKLQRIQDRKHAQLLDLCKEKMRDEILAREWEIFEEADVIDTWIALISRINTLGLVASDDVLHHWLRSADNVIFEGAQGVLLDADAGFHPYTTWSCCTSANARDLIREMAPDLQVFQIGVMRSYALRHGPGPLPSETQDIAGCIHEHNQYNEWQGKVRYGWFDAVLARYALSVSGKMDVLAITHMDILSRLKVWKYCSGYFGQQDLSKFVTSKASDNIVTNFRFPSILSLAERAQFTQSLLKTTPIIEVSEPIEGNVIHTIESLSGQTIGIISRGPKAQDVIPILPLPP